MLSKVHSPINADHLIRFSDFANSVLDPSLHLSRSRCATLLHAPRTCLPPSLDLRWLRECELLLRYYAGLEPGTAHLVNRHIIRGPERRMGERAARRQGEGSQTDMS